MKILVTGGAGFIGSHLVDAYLEDGHRVYVLDNLVSGDPAHLNPGAEFVRMDIADPAGGEWIREQRFDLVNHHAAQVDVRVAVRDPVSDARANILGSLNVIDAAAQSGVKRLIFASSGGAVYGEVDEADLPAPENHPINPVSPYGAAKHAVEHYLFYFGKTFGLSYAVLRYGNVYGERQGKKGEAGVVSIFARQMLRGKGVTVFGNGEQLRDYVYVKDVVEANRVVSDLSRTLPEAKGFNDPAYNIGTGRGTSVNRLFELLEAEIRSGIRPDHAPERPGEIFKTFIDCTKAREELGWSARTDFASGAAATAAWFRDNLDRFPEPAASST
jgi:UDP-glucose 4-epimerase